MPQETKKAVKKTSSGRADEEDILFELLEKSVRQAIDPNKVFFTGMRGGTVVFTLGGKTIPEKTMRDLQSEAKVMQGLGLYHIILETLEHTAKLKMFEQMQNLEDSHYGKTMLYNVDVIRKVINNLANVKIVDKELLTRKPTRSHTKTS